MLLSKLNSVGAIFISWPEAADVIHGIARRESVAKGPTEEREREKERRKADPPSTATLFPSPSFFAAKTCSVLVLGRLTLYDRLCTLYARRLLSLPISIPTTLPPLLILFLSHPLAFSSRGQVTT